MAENPDIVADTRQVIYLRQLEGAILYLAELLDAIEARVTALENP